MLLYAMYIQSVYRRSRVCKTVDVLYFIFEYIFRSLLCYSPPRDVHRLVILSIIYYINIIYDELQQQQQYTMTNTCGIVTKHYICYRKRIES